MPNLKILTATEARAIGCGETDSVTFGLAIENARAGKPAFWSAHSYHTANLTSAAFIANDEGLNEACRYIVAGALDRGWDRFEWLNRFFDRLHPANSAARTEILFAQSQWLATFDERAA